MHQKHPPAKIALAVDGDAVLAICWAEVKVLTMQNARPNINWEIFISALSNFQVFYQYGWLEFVLVSVDTIRFRNQMHRRRTWKASLLRRARFWRKDRLVTAGRVDARINQSPTKRLFLSRLSNFIDHHEGTRIQADRHHKVNQNLPPDHAITKHSKAAEPE